MTLKTLAADLDFALVPPPAEGWDSKSACLGKDPEIWFGERESQEQAIARAVCLVCPVIRSCAAFALKLVDKGESSQGTWASVHVPDHNAKHVRDKAYRELFNIATKGAR